MQGSGRHIAGWSAGIFLALSACAPVPAIKPQARPYSSVQPTVATPPERSDVSYTLEKYYARMQNDLLANDLLRSDGGGPDTPFNARQLAKNFDAIALNDEYTSLNGQYVAQMTPSNLHRWEVPVRVSLEFGPTVSESLRATDRATLDSLVSRLARASGHSISVTSSRPNFHVLVLNEGERRKIGPRLAEMIPGIGQDAIRSVVNMPRSSYCLVLASDPNNDGAYRSAVAIIRAEHPDLLRKSCFHEEVTQGLGLANDSPYARPSIFNDDEEFALLTKHDELLLRILYDPRLAPGMTPEIARPIATKIAYELMGEDI
ncbi:DUF2927 domain-containing protein [Celeribacter sp. ULVN23_4]